MYISRVQLRSLRWPLPRTRRSYEVSPESVSVAIVFAALFETIPVGLLLCESRASSVRCSIQQGARIGRVCFQSEYYRSGGGSGVQRRCSGTPSNSTQLRLKIGWALLTTGPTCTRALPWPTLHGQVPSAAQLTQWPAWLEFRWVRLAATEALEGFCIRL